MQWSGKKNTEERCEKRRHVRHTCESFSRIDIGSKWELFASSYAPSCHAFHVTKTRLAHVSNIHEETCSQIEICGNRISAGWLKGIVRNFVDTIILRVCILVWNEKCKGSVSMFVFVDRCSRTDCNSCFIDLVGIYKPDEMGRFRIFCALYLFMCVNYSVFKQSVSKCV